MTAKKLEELVGRTLVGAYRLDSILGVGGMGAVFRGVQLAVEREVAVKVLKPMADATDEMVTQMEARFRREAKLTARLKHPNTVQLIDFGATDDGMLYLVLEFLEGQELSRAMRRGPGVMDPQRVARIGHQICLSLAEAHAAGLIHRDLKPDNIFLAEYHGVPDHVKVMDFGISRIIDDTEQTSILTATGLIIGTPKYMAPEQVENKTLSPQTDLYALGVILYELVTGAAPFHAESVMSLAFKHVHETPPPIDPSLGPVWKALLDELLTKDPSARPSSAGEVAGRLQTLASMSSSGSLSRPDDLEVPGSVPSSTETFGDGIRPLGPHSHERGKTQSKKRLFMGLAAATALALGLVVGLAGETNEAPSGGIRPDSGPPVERKTSSERASAAAETPKAAVATPKAAVATPKTAPPTPTRLRLHTTPKGAQVTRHEKPLCTTPCDVTLAGQGETALVIALPGHASRTVVVPLAPGSLVDREYVLTKTTAASKKASKPRARSLPKRSKRQELGGEITR